MDIEATVRELMKKNKRKFGNHRFTVPSPDTYPFQWLWDSCFHAIILSHFDLKAAKREIQSVLSHPLPSGMLPHMIYWKDESLDEDDEDVLPNWGREERGAEINAAWKNKGASSITQPPLVAMATLRVYEVDKDLDFLRPLYGPLRQHFAYLATERTFNDDALVYIINPDESGEDNSPRFDEALLLPTKHTASEHLDKRLALMHQNAACNFAAKSCMSNHFGVADVSFNVLYADDLMAMAKIAHLLGYREEATEYSVRAAAVQCDLMEQLRSKDVFLSYDRVHKVIIPVLTWNIFMPLYGGFLTPEEAKNLVDTYLRDEKYFMTPHGLTTTAKTEDAYDPNDGFWRGPIWLAPHWFLYHGLKRYGFMAEAELIQQKTRALIERSGFREHYHPETGEGMGAKDFTWGGLIVDMK
jgi:glycogen debranching enzyme